MTPGGVTGTSWAMDCYGNLFAGDKNISDVQVNHSSYLGPSELLSFFSKRKLAFFDKIAGNVRFN